MSSTDHHPQEHEKESLLNALESLVGLSSSHQDGSSAASLQDHSSQHNALTPSFQSKTNTEAHKAWWSKFFPSQDRIDQLLADESLGNYVVVRGQNKELFESMPLYVRLGMHMLFFHSKKASLLKYKDIDEALTKLSLHQGRVYDDASDPKAVQEHIQSFVETYQIALDELAEPDLSKYKTFNEFFYRQLKPETRPLPDPTDLKVISSAADCRLTVFDSVDEATKIWIKGKHFSLPELFQNDDIASQFPAGSSLAIFRLAPADYHRFHSPIGPSTLSEIHSTQGSYLTVNPCAVNQDFDVFTSNRRDTVLCEWSPTEGTDKKIPVAFVAVGAMLVGGIHWTSSPGASPHRGQELGYFAYGGSTCIAVFPPEAKVKWDEDIKKNSLRQRETIVRVGERIGSI